MPASKHPQIRWIDSRENLQETIGFPIVYGVSCKISIKPIHWQISSIDLAQLWRGWETQSVAPWLTILISAWGKSII